MWRQIKCSWWKSSLIECLLHGRYCANNLCIFTHLFLTITSSYYYTFTYTITLLYNIEYYYVWYVLLYFYTIINVLLYIYILQCTIISTIILAIIKYYCNCHFIEEEIEIHRRNVTSCSCTSKVATLFFKLLQVEFRVLDLYPYWLIPASFWLISCAYACLGFKSQ